MALCVLEKHVLDPDGDVTLVFNSKDINVGNAFEATVTTRAQWNVETKRIAAKDISADELNVKEDETGRAGDLEFDDSIHVSKIDRKHTISTGFKSMYKDKKSGFWLYDCGEADIEVRVSSTNLCRSSSVFRVMLGPDFREGLTLRNEKHVRIPLPGDHFHGIMILLKAIHGKYDWADHARMDLSRLMELAMMVDKYDLTFSLASFPNIWYDEMIHSHGRGQCLPQDWSPEILSWIWLLKALGLDGVMNEMMDCALDTMTETLYDCELPMEGIIETLQKNRLESISLDIESFKAEIMVLKECNRVGSVWLQRKIENMGLHPWPEQPFYGWTIRMLRNRLNSFTKILLKHMDKLDV